MGNVEPSSIEVGNDHLNFTKATEAAQEWRLTLGKEDLPDELQIILEECHELHMRWATSSKSKLLSPVVARVPSGLHVFFTPRKAGEESSLCGLIQTLSGLKASKCDSVSNSFSRPQVLSERFAASATYQYYQASPLSTRVGRIFFRKICNTLAAVGPALGNCNAQIEETSQASHIDLDFDAISQSVTLSILFDVPDGSHNGLLTRRAARPIQKLRENDKIEVGAFHPERSAEPEELSLGGYLTIIGEDDEPKPTLFSFPSRHHPLPSSTPLSLKTYFQQPTGLHPKLDISLQRQELVPPKDSCHLHAYMTLPSPLFIDRYQLSDSLFLKSQNLVALRSLSGEEDLEAPEWAVDRWGSAALFELATPHSNPLNLKNDESWAVTIPTHLRYVKGPKQEDAGSSESTLKIPWPVVFWACEAEEGLKMSTNPFERVNMGYDGLFGPKTMFYHIPPAADVNSTVHELQVPVLVAEKAAYVQLGTLIAVAIGFAWVCWQLVRSSSGGTHQYSKIKKKE